MKTIYLCNAFSINMLKDFEKATVIFHKATLAEVKEILNHAKQLDAKIVASIGHKDLANLVNQLLDRTDNHTRNDIIIDNNDIIFIAQYKGERLPEGTTTLPENSQIVFYSVEVDY